MLCAGVVHGDLSEYNILAAADGPVIIDFPQAVEAAGNQARNTRITQTRQVGLGTNLRPRRVRCAAILRWIPAS